MGADVQVFLFKRNSFHEIEKVYFWREVGIGIVCFIFFLVN